MITEQLEKRQGESEYEHHKRIIYGKLVDKSLSDYDFSELSKYAYGQEYSPDVARRLMYGSQKTIALMERESVDKISDNDMVKDINNRMAELQKEKQRYYDQRREYNKLLTKEGRLEHLYSVIESASSRMPEFVNTHVETKGYSDHNTEAVVVFSDWHYGMVANNEFNRYDTEICADRVHKVVDAVIQRAHLHKCKKVNVVILGDLIHGAIHTSARVASEELTCDQLMHVSEILANAIYDISRHVESVSVYMTYGNHARVVANKNDSIHGDNLEKIVPWWLKQRFANVDNITVNDCGDNEFIIIDSLGHKICAAHGDLDSVRQSPTLLSTLFMKTRNINIEYVILGDKHHDESFEELGIKSMLCGSLCGSDNYANEKRLFSLPSQLMLIMNEKDGVDAEYRIKC